MKSSSRRRLSRVVCLIVVTATIQLPPTSAQTPPNASVISRADAVADLDALFDAIERIHPAPYFSRSRELVATDRHQLTDTLPETMTRIEWWRRLAPIVASLGDAGTLAVWTQTSPKAPRRAEPFFSGPVCVVTGPRTFSAAVSLADAVKTYRLATIVGEETGGRTNMTMEPLSYVLPRTKFVVAIAAGRVVRADGNADDRSGVIPDIVVKTTASDIRDGRDPVLDRARDCPRSKRLGLPAIQLASVGKQSRWS